MWVTIVPTWEIVGQCGAPWPSYATHPRVCKREVVPGMFYGEFEHNLDDKGRVTLPSSFRGDLQNGVFVTRGPEGCLLLFDIDVWGELARKLKKGSISRHITRVLFAGNQSQLDRHGRILIPAPLREYAGLTMGEPAVLVGVDDRLEIWSRDGWDRITHSVVADGQFERELAELGL